ncbi:squalene--hopene cyclase [Ectobacillus panaciterrae]|uniref:squalene--hopene cyclase n=1 Tax=Ectobacillus panaciterrae TaxID=363872 RepID=UPI0003FF6DCC|nr:squalene--hopene cyclase [Ectobacillus panaciterrae]
MELHEHIQGRIADLRRLQYADGTWRFCFEGAPLTDCFMIMTLQALHKKEDRLMNRLTERIAGLQDANGAWKLYKDEQGGNLSATIGAYMALLMSGRFSKSDSNMRRAEDFIKARGGLARTHFMTKFMLALFGQYPYPKRLSLPMTIFLLPPSAPFSIYELSNYARIHLTPLIVCMNKRFVAEAEHVPDLSHLLGENPDWFKQDRVPFLDTLLKEGKQLASYPVKIHQKGYQAAEDFMLKRLEENGTLYSYASATFYMIYAMLALGYKEDAPVISQALQGLSTYFYETERGLHLQNSPSEVWDTALLSYALQEAGVPPQDPMITAANEYLLLRQHTKKGDWAVHAPKAEPGGWGFSDMNTFVPDNDDTSAALRAITRQASREAKYETAWKKGLNWLLQMQNKDGGWGAFEKGADNEWLTLLPIDNAEDAIIDSSTADITGRVLEFLGTYAGMNEKHRIVKRAVEFLVENQREDGSWYGKWGICYIYGTWAAVTGMRAAGVSANHPALQKAVRWLESIQHSDGGWGESCQSSEKKRFMPFSFSTPSQTAWAIDAIMAVKGKEASSVQRGAAFLLRQNELSETALTYPTGLGLPGGFYIRYHSYNHLFPLLALAHYMK